MTISISLRGTYVVRLGRGRGIIVDLVDARDQRGAALAVSRECDASTLSSAGMHLLRGGSICVVWKNEGLNGGRMKPLVV